MDAAELSKRYMEKYEELIDKFEQSDIHKTIILLNEAITESDMDKINLLYNTVMDWNSKVEKLEGARIALDTQYHYLHLPSPVMYCIVYDFEDKEWKFSRR